jgi:cephalosporin hydroxylase
MTGLDLAEVARVACNAHGASQRADELAEALGLVTALDPQIIVEIGCDVGGTLYAWRQICGTVFGITLADNSYETGGQGRPLVEHGAAVRVGDSHDPASLDWLRDQLDGRPVDALVIDGDHMVDGVHADLAMYGPLVRPGGLILLHDIASVGDPRSEVWKVWPELTGRYRTSEIRSSVHSYGWGVIHVTGKG